MSKRINLTKKIRMRIVLGFRKLRARYIKKIVRDGSYIPAEIFEDEFSEQIKKIVRQDDIQILLEIGSSSGEGSTSAIISGLRNKANWTLHLFEIDAVRVKSLKIKFGSDSRIKIHPYSSISLSNFPDRDHVIQFYESIKTNLNRRTLETVLNWYDFDKNFLISSEIAEICGVCQVKSDYSIGNFDFVLIDGSEFTGMGDLKATLGSRYILLDDINSYKCFEAYKFLKSDRDYELIHQNWNLRNGFAIFSHRYFNDQNSQRKS